MRDHITEMYKKLWKLVENFVEHEA